MIDLVAFRGLTATPFTHPIAEAGGWSTEEAFENL